jgi:hypothetical protein
VPHCGGQHLEKDEHHVRLAHDIRAAIKALKQEPDLRPHLFGKKRLLRDWAVGRWEFTSANKQELRRARENFYVHGLGNTANKMLQAVCEHPTASVYEVCKMVAERCCIPAHCVEELGNDAAFCGLRLAVPFLKDVIDVMVDDDAPNMPAYWERAMQRVLSGPERTLKFSSKVTVHEAMKVNHVAGLSPVFIDSICSIVRHAATELEIMHERQSGGLMDFKPSTAERRMFAFVLATNAELESLLGGVDYRTREKRTERTIICGTHAVDDRNQATESLDELDAETLHCWIEAAMEAAPAQAAFEKTRKRQIQDHLVAEVSKKRKKADERYRRQREWLDKMAAIRVVSEVDELGRLSLKELREQMQQAKSASVVYVGLAGQRWKELLHSFKLGSAPAQKYKRDYARERQRYREALTLFLSMKGNTDFVPEGNAFDDVKAQAKQMKE